MYLISVLAAIISSYLISNTVQAAPPLRGRGIGGTGFLYFFLTVFAQIVLTFEILSLFGAISVKGVLICNAAFFVSAVLLYCVKNYTVMLNLFQHLTNKEIFVEFKDSKIPKQVRNDKNLIKQLPAALKRDKALIFLSICFIVFIILHLMEIFCFPVDFADALAYYLPRCAAWLQNGAVTHYQTPDMRELIMPFNTEFLFSWFLMFRKSEAGIGIFSFSGYFLGVYILYNFLRELNFSIRRCLWTVFVFSSFAIVTAEMIAPVYNLFSGVLLLGCIYLFIKSAKYGDKTALFYSALSFALAAGVKTTVLAAAPSVIIILCAVNYVYKNSLKHLFKFAGLFVINFIIFSSYNYILNFLQFSNPLSSQGMILLHRFTGGIKGYCANAVKYFFAVFDMSGVSGFINLNPLIEYFQKIVLSLFGTNIYEGTSPFFPCCFKFDNNIGVQYSVFGASGLFTFWASIPYAVKRFFKRKKSETSVIMFILALSMIFNILLFSRLMVFTSHNMRHLLTFAMIAMPIAAYSYPAGRHKIFKIILCIIICLYLTFITHSRSVSYISQSIKARKIIKLYTINEENGIYQYFAAGKPVNAALIINHAPVFLIEKLIFSGFSTDRLTVDNIEDYDLSKYNYIISDKFEISSTNVLHFKEKIKYPERYKTKCTYYDYKHKEIFDFNEIPVMSNCEIPLEYIKEQGFTEDKNYKGSKYIVLKKREN